MRRYLIIGSGAAGISAAETIRQADAAGEIILVCEEASGYYSRPGLAYYLNGEIPEKFLFPFSDRDFQRLNLKQVFKQAVKLDAPHYRVELEDGSWLSYDRLLIATGSTALLPRLPGIDLHGVVKLDNLEDARHILKLVRKTRRAVVVGGGITALEIVEGLVERGVKVTYLLRGDRYWSNVLDNTESQMIEHRLQKEGVEICCHSELAEIVGRKGRVSGVRTQDGKVTPCQMVAVAIGVRPRLEIGRAAGLLVERGLLVDEHLQTSLPDIFAAGDVAQVFDPLTGRRVLDTLWGAARDQGRAAGENMAGLASSYHKPVAFNVTRLAGLTTTLIGAVGGGTDKDLVGIARGDSETWRHLPDAITAQDEFEINRLRLLVGSHTLVGAVVMGDQALSKPLQELVAHQVDIQSIRLALLAPQAQLGRLIIDFWSDWKKKHADHPQENS